MWVFDRRFVVFVIGLIFLSSISSSGFDNGTSWNIVDAGCLCNRRFRPSPAGKMSSTQEGTSSRVRSKKSEKGRRIWRHEEELVLIALLKELVAQGWKTDNSFRAGYLNRLEVSMKRHFPDTNLRAVPMIQSKVGIWKKNYSIVGNILSRSGVGFNGNGNHKIECEDDTWEQVKKAVPLVDSFRYKSWPYYDDWVEIFGTDRANGENAEDVGDASQNMRDRDEIMTGNDDFARDYDISLEDLELETAAESNSNNRQRSRTEVPPKKNKKQKSGESIGGVCDILIEIGRKADARLASLADSLGYEARLGQALEDAFEHLALIPTLSTEERFEVCAILGAQPDKLKIFKGLPGNAREEFVAWLMTKYK